MSDLEQKVWEVAIAGLKGKERHESIVSFIDTYHKEPQIPILHNGISEFQ